MKYRITEENKRMWMLGGLDVVVGDVFEVEFVLDANDEYHVATIDWRGDRIHTWTARQEIDILGQMLEDMK